MDKRIFISRRSALHYWRWRRAHSPRLRYYASGMTSVDGCLHLACDMRERLGQLWTGDEMAEMFGRRPLEVLAPSVGSRPQRGSFIPHLQSKALPAGSFVEVADGVYVESPALVFARMAHHLDRPRLVALGMELCGSYALPCRSGDEARFGLTPVLEPSGIRSYLASLGRPSSGSALSRATDAAKHVIGGSASPMETVCCELLCLPLRFGGYGIEPPLLNTWLDARGALTHDRNLARYKPDLLWPRCRLIVEYDGRRVHAEREEPDARRADALRALGYGVIALRRADLADVTAFDALARHLARETGRRPRPAPGFPAARDGLRASLLALGAFERDGRPPSPAKPGRRT